MESDVQCPKCNEYQIDVDDRDEPDGSGIYYRMTCENCGFCWNEDGPDY